MKKQGSAKEHHLGIRTGDIQVGLGHTGVEAASSGAAARDKSNVEALSEEPMLVRA